MKKATLSAIIVAKNEEVKIKGCLKSLTGWCDEIIVIDSGSTDKTIEISKSYKARVFEYEKGGFSDWRNKGAQEANGEWILYVDADERVTPNLRNEISELISNFQLPIINYGGFAIPRRNIILGRQLSHGGWWPDYVKRLFLKSKFKKWTGELHEEPVFEGELGHLENPFIHQKHDNLTDMVEKTNKWSEIEAGLMYDAKHPEMNILRFASAGLREFYLRMIKQAAFLDGAEGVIYALYQVFSRLTSYAKLWEMQIQTENSKLKTQN